MYKFVRPNSFNGLLHNCIFRIFGDVVQEVFKQGLQASLVIRERQPGNASSNCRKFYQPLWELPLKQSWILAYAKRRAPR